MVDEEPGIIKLGKLIANNALRVEHDAPDAVDVGFFGILLAPDTDLTALKLKNAIQRAEQGVESILSLDDFYAEEQGLSWPTISVWIGDQGLALALIGLGAALELWDIVKPSDVGILDEALVTQMLNMGFLFVKVGPDSILRS